MKRLLCALFLCALSADAQVVVTQGVVNGAVLAGGGGGGGITVNDLIDCSTPSNCYQDTTGNATTQSISYNSGDHVYVVWGVSMTGGLCDDLDTNAVSGGTNITWELVGYACDDGNQRRSMLIWRGAASANGSGVLTLSYSPNNATQEGYAWGIVALAGVNAGDPDDIFGEGFQGFGTTNSTADLGTPDTGDIVIGGCSVELAAASAVRNAEMDTTSPTLENFDGPVGLRTLVTGWESSPDATPQPGITWTGDTGSTCIGVIVND